MLSRSGSSSYELNYSVPEMIERTTAIPLTIYPYSTRSHIVHWLTRHHGLICTLLKAAQHPRSHFLGEYQLFGTSELLYYTRHKEGLYTAKECALLQPRESYRQNWRAMQTASYLTALFRKILPQNAPAPHLFHQLELLLDYTLHFHAHPLYLPWCELFISQHEGNTPQLNQCGRCQNSNVKFFDPAQGTALCQQCAYPSSTPIQPLSPQLQALIQTLLQTEIPHNLPTEANHTTLLPSLNHLTGTFISTIYQLPTVHRNTIAA